MARKYVINSQGTSISTDAAERMSQEFDRKYDVRNTFTWRLLTRLTGKSDDSVRQAFLLAIRKAGGKTSNVKVRFPMKYAEEHMEELIELSKKAQLECEARILEFRNGLSEVSRNNGRKVALQNYTRMIMKQSLSSSVSEDSINTALANTGDVYIPESSKIEMQVDFVGVTPDSYGLTLEKSITIDSTQGSGLDASRVITQLAGSKSCPIDSSNKDIAADSLYEVMQMYKDTFENTRGDDPDQLLQSLTSFVDKFRKHTNTQLEDTKLNQDEIIQANEWAAKAKEYMFK